MPYNNMLQEISKASAVKAVAALSKFLNTPLKFNIKPVEISSVQKIMLPAYSNAMTVGLYAPIKGSIVKGGSSFLSTQDAALSICDLLLNRKEGTTKNISEIEESALKELANIVLGNFLTPFARSLLTSSLMHAPAIFEQDTSQTINKHTRELLTEAVGQDAAINISFCYEHDNIKGDINIILEAKKTNALLNEIMVISNG